MSTSEVSSVPGEDSIFIQELAAIIQVSSKCCPSCAAVPQNFRRSPMALRMGEKGSHSVSLAIESNTLLSHEDL